MTITGIVKDASSNENLEFATISLFNNQSDKLIDGSLTDENGAFELKTTDPNVFLKIEFISYQPLVLKNIPFSNGTAELGLIQMSPDSEILDDVIITAEKSETVFALDKKVFTVGKDLANRGGSAEDILDNVPSVTVDLEGNVSLRGNNGVRILIDGRPSGLAGIGNTNGLRNIPANLIEKVEVITNPSARYEAEGMAGIINIILKKNQSGGFNGSFDLVSGWPIRIGQSSNLNYRKNNINWFLNYGLNYTENNGGGQQIQDRILNEERNFSLLDRDLNRSGISNSFRGGLDYFFSDNEQLTASFLYRKSDEDNENVLTYSDYISPSTNFEITPLWLLNTSNPKSLNFSEVQDALENEELYNLITRVDDETENEKNLEYSLNYLKTFSSREHKLNISGQFVEKSETESSDLVNSYKPDLPGALEDLNQTSSNSESQKNWLAQLDYVHPLGKDHKYEAGLRHSFRYINNDFIVQENVDNVWVKLNDFTNNFDYDEIIHAGYFIYGNTINKFSYQFGVRGEYSLINTKLEQDNIENRRDYANLFPSGFLNYNVSEKTAFQVSYSRRVRRPRFWDLNPFFTFFDNRNFFSGNPNLDPEFTDSYELGQIQYWDKITLNTSLFYRTTQGSIQRVLIIDNLQSETLRTPLNLGKTTDYGLDLSINYNPNNWFRLDGNWNLFINSLSLEDENINDPVFDYYNTVRNYNGSRDEFNNQFDFSLNEFSTLTWNARLTARITMFNSDLQIRANYRASRETAQGRSQGIPSVDIGWSKDFLSNKNLTLTFSIRDLFNSRKRNGITIFDDFYQQSDFQWRARTATLTASYRINQKKQRTQKGGNGGDYGGGDY